MKIQTKAVASVAVAVALTLGLGSVAFASTLGTSMSDWTTGHDGPARNASSSTASQSIKMSGCKIATGANYGTTHPSSYQQMQLQKDNVFGQYISVGNKETACTTTDNWGAQGSGSYRYQLNTATDATTGSRYTVAGTFLYAAPTVVINY